MKKKKIDKKIYIIIALILLIIIVGIIIFIKRKANYEAYLELNLKDSNTKVIYSPNNTQKLELTIGNTLTLNHTFTNNKEHKYKYIIKDNDIITIENDKIIAQKEGVTNVYLKTNDGVKSNIIYVTVIDPREENESDS